MPFFRFKTDSCSVQKKQRKSQPGWVGGLVVFPPYWRSLADVAKRFCPRYSPSSLFVAPLHHSPLFFGPSLTPAYRCALHPALIICIPPVLQTTSQTARSRLWVFDACYALPARGRNASPSSRSLLPTSSTLSSSASSALPLTQSLNADDEDDPHTAHPFRAAWSNVQAPHRSHLVFIANASAAIERTFIAGPSCTEDWMHSQTWVLLVACDPAQSTSYLRVGNAVDANGPVLPRFYVAPLPASSPIEGRMFFSCAQYRPLAWSFHREQEDRALKSKYVLFPLLTARHAFRNGRDVEESARCGPASVADSVRIQVDQASGPRTLGACTFPLHSSFRTMLHLRHQLPRRPSADRITAAQILHETALRVPCRVRDSFAGSFDRGSGPYGCLSLLWPLSDVLCSAMPSPSTPLEAVAF
ncbi:hypothetical protein B0H16DRAFT_1735803 [Mycena metata]|uniref:Uncharacterized protein n=1 Tax=Mycena metata TaxID=1033252 RepID=A0AAD7MP78_9AGAR|nr:hypothetical protein B0H16DRAFT_1735803 [Mycena metata]